MTGCGGSALPSRPPGMSDAPSGNGHCTDTHTHALDLLRDALGATVIATYPNARAPLPATGPAVRGPASRVTKVKAETSTTALPIPTTASDR